MVEEAVRAHVSVRGRVQGVGFRIETRRRAGSLDLGGWVRNRPDGTVEAVFEGPKERVESLLRWCREGPRGAIVDELSTLWEQPIGEQGFRIS
jgi:acylphosphatase